MHLQLLRILAAFLCLSIQLRHVLAATYRWLQDSYSVTGVESSSSGQTKLSLTLSSNRQVIEGSYQLKLSFISLASGIEAYNTSCIPYHSTSDTIKTEILSILSSYHKAHSLVTYDTSLVQINRKGNASAYYNHGYSYSITGYSSLFNVTSTSTVSMSVAGMGTTRGCPDILTYGEYSDGSQWHLGTVPTSTDSIQIDADTGIVALTASLTIRSMVMKGGTLVLGQTDCPAGWSPSPDSIRNKCFMAFTDSLLSRDDAESACRLIHAPMQRGHLARIESEAENSLLRGLCRGVADRATNCWHGLRANPLVPDSWGWEEETTMLGTTYRNWQWHEPNNRTHLDGYESCTVMKSSFLDPWSQLRAVWNDEDCSSPKPYLCERRAVTKSYNLTVSAGFSWRGGTIAGPGFVILNGTLSYITGSAGKVLLESSATLVVKRRLNITANTFYGSSASIINYAVVDIRNTSSTLAYDTTPLLSSSSPRGYRPILQNKAGAIIRIKVSSGMTCSMQWVLQNAGSLQILSGKLDLQGGGQVTKGTISVASPHSLWLGNEAVQMMQPAVQELRLSAAHPIMDTKHHYGSTSTSQGTFRLSFGNSKTTCLPYHITAEALQDALNALPSINAMGNVSVSRSGQGSDARWSYGYKHRIVFDKLTAYNKTLNTAIKLDCAGSNNGCSCLSAAASFITNGNVRYSCAAAGASTSSSSYNGNTTHTNPLQCTILPNYTISVLYKGGEPTLSGTGSLYIYAGRHLLPSTIGLPTLEIQSVGEAIVSSSTFAVSTLTVRHKGQLVLVGPGMYGMDLAYLDLEQNRQGVDESLSDTFKEGRWRTASTLLSAPPPIWATINTIHMYNGSLAVASSYSNVSISRLLWEGGDLSGRANFRILSSANINDTTTVKALRDGARLINEGTITWTAGNISMAEKAAIQNLATISIKNLAGAKHRPIMYLKYDPPLVSNEHTPGRCWDEEDIGWYPNPICGGDPACSASPYLDNVGTISMSSNTSVDISILVSQRGKTATTTLSGDAQLHLSLKGNLDGTVNIAKDANLIMKQGNYTFTTTSKVQGQGNLIILQGYTTLPPILYTRLHLTQEGTAVSTVMKAIFYRDVLIEGNGRLWFNVRQQNVSVHGNFTLQENGVVLFEDGRSVWRDERMVDDRWHMYFYQPLYFRGGTMQGWAWIHCMNTLDLDQATTYLKGGVQLAYYTIAYWGQGDVITSEQADMLHQGILQPKPNNQDASLMHIDTFDGCCPYKTSSLLQWQQ